MGYTKKTLNECKVCCTLQLRRTGDRYRIQYEQISQSERQRSNKNTNKMKMSKKKDREQNKQKKAQATIVLSTLQMNRI